jgi:hypothetical protein
MTADDARQNAQIAQLDNRALRAETLIRQLQGTARTREAEPQGVRAVSELPELGEPGRMVLFAGSVWVDTGGAWKKLAFTEEVADGTEAV